VDRWNPDPQPVGDFSERRRPHHCEHGGDGGGSVADRGGLQSALGGEMEETPCQDGWQRCSASGSAPPDPLTVGTVKNFALSDIKSNSYVGIATRTLPGGQLQAIEVLVFPEAIRGAGEGYYPWDLEQGSMMTNGTVTGTVEAASGQELSLKFNLRLAWPPLPPSRRPHRPPGSVARSPLSRVRRSASPHARGRKWMSR
jgi:hypothetical protein